MTAVNDKPDAVNDPTNAVTEDTNKTIDVLANDTDPEGDALDITVTTNGSKGSVSIMGGGATVRYNPNANATGSDTFTYTIEDIHGLSDTATVTVQIARRTMRRTRSTTRPTPIVEDTTTLIDPLVNDTDPENDALIVTDASDPAKGAATDRRRRRRRLLRPGSQRRPGRDTFTYTISDGNGGTDTATVTVQISSVNDAAVRHGQDDRHDRGHAPMSSP